MKRSLATIVCICVGMALIASPAFAQEYLLNLPRSSPRARVSQTIGITEITVDYGRPGVKGRKVWGDIVPYEQVWRAGADENTTITFSTAVTIAGRAVPAGTYGLHMIPGPVYWVIILSKQHRAWGSFTYDPAEDATRVTVRTRAVPHRERLLYLFDEIAPTTSRLALEWERLQIGFDIEVDVNATVVAELNDALRGLPGRRWHGWHKAAEWCWAHSTNLEEANIWVDRSIAWDRNFFNLRLKSLILEKLGYAERAAEIMQEAFSIATPEQVYAYADILMADGETDRAISVLKENVRKHSDSWLAHQKLADAYFNRGDRNRALKHYSDALAAAKDPNVRQIIQAIIDEIK